MKPGERKFVKVTRLVLREVYEQRDDPPGRGPGVAEIIVFESEQVIPNQNVKYQLAEMVRSTA